MIHNWAKGGNDGIDYQAFGELLSLAKVLSLSHFHSYLRWLLYVPRIYRKLFYQYTASVFSKPWIDWFETSERRRFEIVCAVIHTLSDIQGWPHRNIVRMYVPCICCRSLMKYLSQFRLRIFGKRRYCKVLLFTSSSWIHIANVQIQLWLEYSNARSDNCLMSHSFNF